jgi:glycosyltransferase involved in cell wall biosynthesis
MTTFGVGGPEDRRESDCPAVERAPREPAIEGAAQEVAARGDGPAPSGLPGNGRLRRAGVADLQRIAKLLLFYFRKRLASWAQSGADSDGLAWTLANSYEFLPAGWRRELADLLEINANPARRHLFRHWLRERDYPAEPDLGPSPDAVGDGLAIYGFFHAETGVGQAGRALARAFGATGLPMSCHAVAAPDCFRNNVAFPVSASMSNERGASLLVMNAEPVAALDHFFDRRLLARNRKIGMFFWELPVFPGVWARACDEVDEIWVSTSFVRDSLMSATDRPVRVLPLPVPLNDLDPGAARKALGLPPDRLICLVTFDFNSFPERKNPLGAVRAFADAFPAKTDSSPLLVVKCHGAGNRAVYEPQLRAAVSRNPNMTLIDRVMSAQDIRQLQAASDIYLSLHRSEGFGLNLAECMAAGKLTIATRFSGNLDFMDDSNSLLLDYDMRPVREGEYIAWQGQWWAAPRHDDAVSALRLAAGSSGLRGRLGAAARAHVGAELSDARIGARMAELVRPRV